VRAASFTDFAQPAAADTCLTFGKHRGVPLSQVESSYLEWVKTADRITPDLLAAIDAELATRTKKPQDKWRAPAGVSETTLLMARLIVETGAAEVGSAVGDAFHVDQARELLKHMLDLTALESDPGSLPF
jgi:hypothetical protein